LNLNRDIQKVDIKFNQQLNQMERALANSQSPISRNADKSGDV